MKFAYRAIDQNGVEQFDVVEADDEKDALRRISEMGLFPTEVHRASVTDELRHSVQSGFRQERERREREEAARRKELRRKHPRQQLVVHFPDGSTMMGVSFHLDHHEDSFLLDVVDEKGRSVNQRERIEFARVKGVYYVKSYDGRFRASDWEPVNAEGEELIIQFADGEVVRGRAQRSYNPGNPRFYFVPADMTGNVLSILVERAATEHIWTPDEYKAYKEQKREQMRAKGNAALSQEETTGDFYFEMRDYGQALKLYDGAMAKGEASRRLLKKLLVTQYNLGVQHIKRREYDRALELMERVLEIDPKNEHARKKAKKLRKITDQMQAFADGSD